MAVSNSRRNVVRAAVAGALLASFAGLAAWRQRTLKGGPRRVVLGILRDSEAARCEPVGPHGEQEHRVALWLTVATLSSAKRSRLLDLTEKIADSFEAKRHPFVTDLSDEAPDEALKGEAPWLLPVWTAARAVVRRCFVSGDRKLSVLVPSPQAPLPEGIPTFEPFSDAVGEPDLRLARFLSWPISSAKLVAAPVGQDADTLWNSFRERSTKRSSSVALVIDAMTQAVKPSSLLDQEQLTRFVKLRTRMNKFQKRQCERCSIFDELMTALSQGPPPAPALPWLELGPREALVVPRLSSVARSEEFEGELVRLLDEAA